MFTNHQKASGGTPSMLSLIERIYSGVGQEAEWSGVLDSLNEAVGAEQTLIFSPVVGSGATVSARTPRKLVQDFLGYYAGVNVLAAPCDRMFPTGAVRYSHWALPDGEFERSEFYNDFFQRHNVFYSMGLKVPLGAGGEAYLNCQRAKSRGPFDETEGLVYATLLPHLQRALSLHARYRQMQANVLGLEEALDAHEHAVIGIDATGHVLFCNPRAERLLSSGNGLAVAGGRLICKTSAASNTKLQKLLKREAGAARGLDREAGGPSTLLIERGAMQGALQLAIFPFQGALAGQSARLAALVFVSNPAHRPRSRATTLQALYGLTPSEARVTDLLLEGLQGREIAERLGVTHETSRFHLKRVLAKTGTRRQAELMQLILSLPSSHP